MNGELSTVSPAVSVIICTYNRCESLRKTLQTCCALEVPAGLAWELLVVDNNSSDATNQVCQSFTSDLPIRYIFERAQGQSPARNHGVRESKGSLLLFTDDDVNVDHRWLAEIWGVASQHPDAAFFGGKVLPEWESPPPRWLLEHSVELAGVAMHYELGDRPRFLASGESTFFGANMAFRREAFDKGASFDENLGLKGNDPTRSEETDFMQRLGSIGFKGFYIPEAVVYHRNPRSRMTERYVRQWFIGYGITEVRCGEVRLDHCWFGTPPHAWKAAVLSCAKYLATRWTRASAVWLPAEIRMATSWGVIKESRRLFRSRSGSNC
jgi:glycosyltransferase involved in cell wall biosynthesis